MLLGSTEKVIDLEIKINRFTDRPIIPPFLVEEIGSNIQGPSLVKAPKWLKNPLAKYYLYFADHKGDRIKLAYANDLIGPWKVLLGGTLQLKNSYFLTEKPQIPDDFDIGALGIRDAHKDHIEHIPKKIDDLTIPHIASPDVHIDDQNKRFVMYFHGLDEFGLQKTRVAESKDGINFKAKEKIVGWPYFRRFSYMQKDYALSMPGIIYEGSEEIEEFNPIIQIMEERTRHSAVKVYGDKLLIFFTRKGDVPERILMTTVDLTLPVSEWKTTKPVDVLRPEKEWEGALLPNHKSAASAINIPVNQLRDPAVFSEENKNYLLYSLRGENGIGIVEFSVMESKK
tara:strand:+ start:543 stop:1565 length:1023 start_codon:yes stop_codon:yes gene_type:complete